MAKFYPAKKRKWPPKARPKCKGAARYQKHSQKVKAQPQRENSERHEQKLKAWQKSKAWPLF